MATTKKTRTATSKAEGMFAADCQDIPDRHPLEGVASFLRAQQPAYLRWEPKTKFEEVAKSIIIRAQAGLLTDNVGALADYIQRELRCHRKHVKKGN